MAYTTTTKKQTRFDGGISDSTRMGTSNGCAMVKHFDIFSDPERIIPHRNLIPDEDTTFKIVKFSSNLSGILYGYGVVVGSGKVKIYQKSDAISGSWTAATTGEDAGGTRATDCFVLNGAVLYGFTAGNRLWSYNTGTNVFNNSFQSVPYTTVAQGIVGKKDGVMYLPYDNKIATLQSDGTTWNSTAFTLPTGVTITDIEEYGNYIAISTNTSGGFGNKSAMYIWDRAKPTTPDEVVDFGEELLKIIANIEGTIIGISYTPTGYSLTPRIVIRQWQGGDHPTIIKELVSQNTTCAVGFKQQKGSLLFFSATIKLNGTTEYGIFCIGRKSSSYNRNISLAYLPDGDTLVTSIEGFYFYGDYLFVAHNNDGSVNRTNNSSTYTTTSVYETEIYGGETGLKKTLKEANLNYVPLPSAGQVVLKFRKDSQTSWTTMFTETTDNQILTNYNDNKAGQWSEIQLRIESTGGAEITGVERSYTYGE